MKEQNTNFNAQGFQRPNTAPMPLIYKIEVIIYFSIPQFDLIQ